MYIGTLLCRLSTEYGKFHAHLMLIIRTKYKVTRQKVFKPSTFATVVISACIFSVEQTQSRESYAPILKFILLYLCLALVFVSTGHVDISLSAAITATANLIPQTL